MYDGDEIGGNQAIYDMLKALEWVKNNIGQFYGDPDRITIFGESAGGFATATLLSSVEASKLFSKAIIQSAPLSVPFRTLENSMDFTKHFLRRLRCRNLECAMRKSAQQVSNFKN